MLVQTAYDQQADALYVRLREGNVARTDEIDELTFVDVDASGDPLGIEVLHPARAVPTQMIFERYNIHGSIRRLLEQMFPEFGVGRVLFPDPRHQVVSTGRPVLRVS
jgi:uncharacterized protein YuzE